MTSALLAFGGGLVVLFVAGHFVVTGASRIGQHFGLSPLVIGLTIVAAGTSAPELAVVFQSIAVDDTELAVGSIIGSNIANILLVLGLAATFGTIHVAFRSVRTDIPVMIAASLAFVIFSLDGQLSRRDGLLFVTGLVVFVYWTLKSATRSSQSDKTASDTTVSSRPLYDLRFLVGSLLALIAGIGGLALAARFVVAGAERIAVSLGVPELIVGLTIVALGTSAPEIVTTLVAAVQGRRDLAVGSAVGSNIFNILLVLGASSLVAPQGISIGDTALTLDLPVMVAAAVACLPLVLWDKKFDRLEGIVFVGFYGAYLLFLVLDAIDHEAKQLFVVTVVGLALPAAAVAIGVATARHLRQTDRADGEGPRPDEQKPLQPLEHV